MRNTVNWKKVVYTVATMFGVLMLWYHLQPWIASWWLARKNSEVQSTMPGFLDAASGALDNVVYAVTAVCGGPMLWYYLPALGAALVLAVYRVFAGPDGGPPGGKAVIGPFGLTCCAAGLYTGLYTLLLLVAGEWAYFGRMLGVTAIAWTVGCLAAELSDRPSERHLTQ